MKKHPPTWRKWNRIIAINFAFIAAGIVILELLFGSWFTENSYGQLILPRNIQRTFDVSVYYDHAGPITYTRDRYGLRGPYENVSDIDILVMGGSTTNELYIDDEETWLAVARSILAENGKPMTIVNAGADGQSSRGHIYNFEAWFPNIPGLSARYMLVFVGFNDMQLRDHTRPAHYDHLAYAAPIKQATAYLKNHSALWLAFQRLKGWWEAKRANVVHSGTYVENETWVPAPAANPATQDDPTLPADLAAYADRLKTLAAKIRATGAEPIFMTQHANGYRLKNGALYGVPLAEGEVGTGPYARMNAFNAATLAVCREENMTCFDLTATVEMVNGDFYDYVHTTPQGSAKISRFVAGEILKKLP